MLISMMTSWSMRFFLPPKEVQPKVRQSHGRAVENDFAFLKLFLGSIGTPSLDHLSVEEEG